jgi:hypothetical protein
MAKIKFLLETKNLGPLVSLREQHETDSLKIGIYANNGTGKTFFSRALRLLNNHDSETLTTDKLLTLHQNEGAFYVNISNPQDGAKPQRTVDIKLKRGFPATIINNTDYIFHVFNSDYVVENLEAHKYSPNGNIDGYILGKINIDLTKEKMSLVSVTEQLDKAIKNIETSIAQKKVELDNLGISKNTNEYRYLSYRNLYESYECKEAESFTELKKLHHNLKSMPDDLPDIPTLSFNFDVDFLTEIQELLQTPYTLSEIAEQFKEKVKNKQAFITQGIELQKSDPQVCPFCEQLLGDKALDLIDLYNKYLDDTEAKIISQINQVISRLKHLQDSLNDNYSKCLKIKSNHFEPVKKYIPSYTKEFLLLPDAQILDDAFAVIEEFLGNKKQNIDKADFASTIPVKTVTDYIARIGKLKEQCNKEIAELNDKKNHTKKEKLSLNRRLCNALYIKIQDDQRQNLLQIKELEESNRRLQQEIIEKENQAKISKKEKVVESLKLFLNLFFKDKYTFDKDNFCIKFLDTSLGSNASDILSDGEKSIVSFCYYLASTHTIVSTEEDYNKIFFIIDDPISSLDFHYVYSVAQVVRTLGTIFSIESNVRFIILTHNLEFMSILIRNQIVPRRYFLTTNSLKPLRKELIMPYESHLRDISDVAGIKLPSHTTPNSIRHVLETIQRFECPHKSLEAYVNEIPELDGNEFIYSLVQDLSHGIVRNQKPYAEEMIKDGCAAVISFVKRKFEGQVASLS